VLGKVLRVDVNILDTYRCLNLPGATARVIMERNTVNSCILSFRRKIIWYRLFVKRVIVVWDLEFEKMRAL